MLNILFIAPDVALLSNESLFTAHSDRPQDKFDITAMKLLDKLCDDAGCQLIICGKWRSQTVTPLWWSSFFKMKGLRNCNFIGQTPPAPTPSQSVEDWLRATPVAIDRYAILDNPEGYEGDTSKLVSPPPMQGLGVVEALKVIHQLKPSAPVLAEWSDVWSPAQ